MRKTSVYLSEAESRRLAELAQREGCSQSEILRDAITAYEPVVGQGADREFLLFDSGSGDGTSVAEIPEDDLLAGFGND
ncbi:MAG: ribbon-helix-helix domain-containing protein [Actinomycetota bacterium]|nr:ribbon-helix-helix domain-containing protein [Actinomycetota bacterium]